MKKNYRTALLLAALSLFSVGCQKENIFETMPSLGAEMQAYAIHYSVDGVPGTVTFSSDSERTVFISHLLALAKEGHRVTLSASDWQDNPSASKDVVTYDTSSYDDANAWTKKMIDNGYHVTVTYDPHSGMYHCVAIN